ncbi:MAG: ribosome maturation factor RimP [Thermodesulfobacteriota bacterium]
MSDIRESASLDERLERLAEPVVSGAGCELVDIVCVVDHGRSVLRVFIDKPGGVTIDDCTVVSRELGAVLDVEDLLPGRYSLEISSPGLNRILKKEKDFKRFIGRMVKISTREPIEGRSHFKVSLDAVSDGALEVTDDMDKKWALKLENIQKANLVPEL